MSTVLLFGTFDGIHAGHRNLLTQASAFGEHLVVIVSRDETVFHVKNRRPKYTEQERLAALQAEPLVSEARFGSLGDKYAAMREIKPDVIALGYDQQAFTEKLEAYVVEHLPHTQIIRLHAFQPDLYKSSLLNK